MTTQHLGYTLETKPAFTGYYVVVIEDSENRFTVIPSESDHTIPASDAHGFADENVAIATAKAHLTRFAKNWKGE